MIASSSAPTVPTGVTGPLPAVVTLTEPEFPPLPTEFVAYTVKEYWVFGCRFPMDALVAEAPAVVPVKPPEAGPAGPVTLTP